MRAMDRVLAPLLATLSTLAAGCGASAPDGPPSAAAADRTQAGAPAVAAQAPERRPNVLLLLTDDQRRDMISALGDQRVRTPHMDRLADEGFAFTSAYVAGSLHGAVCMPSRAMLMTGRHFRELPLGMTMLWDAPAETRGVSPAPTLPELFRAAGYRTHVVGKWHNGPRSLSPGFDGGGAIFFGGMSDHDAVPVHDFDPSGAYPGSARYVAEGFSSEIFADEAVRFLESRRDQEQPFFLWLSFTAPHDPRMAPEPFASMYAPETLALPPNFLPEHPFPIGDLRVRDEKLAGFPRTAEEVRGHLAGYFAMVSHLDAQIGRVLDALDAAGLADDTLVVLAGDNGLAVGQHGLLGKQNVYEHSAGVPLVLRGPGIPAGGRSDALCWLHDLHPTLCAAAGLEAPGGTTARSLLPVVRGEQDTVRDSLLLAYDTGDVRRDGPDAGRMRALRRGEWKLLWAQHGGTTTVRLFDLSTDPWETRDLAPDPAHAATRDALLAELAAVDG